MPQDLLPYFWPDQSVPPFPPGQSVLAYGCGRSYGDSCLNEGGFLIPTRTLDRFISLDAAAGVLRCEAGLTLREVLEVIIPKGWFLPVVPGTQFVTVGGAVANDIHGKNHHRAGSFGNHVRALQLLRSDGTVVFCSEDQNADWLAATIGGLGLTGLITWVEVQLIAIEGPWLEQETIRFDSLREFFTINQESESRFDYTVAWIDSLAKGRQLGRGVFFRGNHSKEQRPLPIARNISVPFTFPEFVLNRLSMRCFNFWFRRKQPVRKQGCVPYQSFFFPLDSIEHWNRIYGKRGLLQYQCVVPPDGGPEAIEEILALSSQAGCPSFLTVLKTFGDRKAKGLLSFPRPGITLTLDYADLGARLQVLLEKFDRIVRDANGALYPAKDARMSTECFQAGFPRLPEFRKFVDPGFSSSFWRRVG